jgi:predicted enzyme related to lactoylglutathione lyase
MPTGRVLAVTIDCREPAPLAAFWAATVGGEIDARTVAEDWVALMDVPGIGNIGFQRVPEQKSVKNRVHIDIDVDDIESAAAEIVGAGGTVRGETVEEHTNYFLVMLDPEGNEFCLIKRKG